MDHGAGPSDDEVERGAGLVAELGLPTHVVTVAPLGSSGHVELWQARDRRRGADVVVKVVPAVRRDRLEAEARALARLGEHHSILRASAVGTAADGRAWLITDRAVGGTLADRIGASGDDVLAWAVELAGALAHAHRHGVVHGDVTPANVFLDADDHVRLGDFGAAELEGTAASVLPGGHTPGFAAPERLRRGHATPASDVYGLGATVLSLLPERSAGVPARRLRVLRRCLRASPRRRPSADSLVRRLQR